MGEVVEEEDTDVEVVGVMDATVTVVMDATVVVVAAAMPGGYLGT